MVDIIGLKIFFSITVLLLSSCFCGIINIGGSDFKSGIIPKYHWKTVDNFLDNIRNTILFFWMLSILNLIWGWS